ncbi:MAG TPA: helicase-exonuclease AddAB subunit AddB, partial [Clostridiales bacterium]|nr:helicase-exonuclease AddAB subunit AddB [Clostridiales bacterium]
MSLRFIYGRAGSGKTSLCLREIRDSIETTGGAQRRILLVPEQYTFQAEKNLTAGFRSGGTLDTPVLSFKRLAYRVFNEAGGITYPHLHPSGKCMILYRVVDAMREQFQVFGRSVDREGFVSTLSKWVTECKRYNVTPEILTEAAGDIQDENPLKKKLMELSFIYARFDTLLTERYRDADDDLTLAAEKLGQTHCFDGAEIWIDGFSSFTPQEYLLIGRLMERAARITVSLCTDVPGVEGLEGGPDLFATVQAARLKLVQLAVERKIPLEEAVHLNPAPLFRFAGSAEMAHLEQGLSVWGCWPWPHKTKDLSLFAAVDLFSEIEAAARDILALCRDEGFRFRDIAVITGNLKGYDTLVEILFGEYGIPCFIDRKTEIMNHPLVRLVLSMMDIFNENWSYEAVFHYLKTGLTGINPESIHRLENYILACGIRGNRWTSSQDWTLTPGLLPDDRSEADAAQLLAEMNAIRLQVIRPLMEFRQKTRGRHTASEHAASLYAILIQLEVPRRIQAKTDEFKQRGEFSQASAWSQVWNMMMDVLDQAVEVMGEDTFGLERFSRILTIGFKEYSMGMIPAGMDQVLVGSMERSKFNEIKAMYILGANDDQFPPSPPAEGILTDQDREMLKKAGVELASDTRTQAMDGDFLVYRALTAATKRIRISWVLANTEGRALRPAAVIHRLRRLFPGIQEKSNLIPANTPEEAMETVTARAPAFRQMVQAFRHWVDGRMFQTVWEDVYRWFDKKQEWQLQMQALREAFLYRNIAQPVNQLNIAGLYGDPMTTSVSRLEKYTGCPFAFFIQYGLNARERKVFEFTAPDVGTFLHAVIERFSTRVEQGEMTWRSFDQDWCREQVSEIVEELLAQMRGSGAASSKRFTALTRRLIRVAGRAVWILAMHIRRGNF